MKLSQIASITNPEEALAAAKAETKGLEERQTRAEARLEKTQQEYRRLQNLQQAVNARVVTLTADHATASRRLFMRASAGEAFDTFAAQLVPLENDKRFAIGLLQHIVEVEQTRAHGERLRTEIEALQAKKDAMEHLAVVSRLGMINATAAAAGEFDPGVRVDVSKSWSAQQMERVEVVARDIERVTNELREHNQKEQGNV